MGSFTSIAAVTDQEDALLVGAVDEIWVSINEREDATRHTDQFDEPSVFHIEDYGPVIRNFRTWLGEITEFFGTWDDPGFTNYPDVDFVLDLAGYPDGWIDLVCQEDIRNALQQVQDYIEELRHYIADGSIQNRSRDDAFEGVETGGGTDEENSDSAWDNLAPSEITDSHNIIQRDIWWWMLAELPDPPAPPVTTYTARTIETLETTYSKDSADAIGLVVEIAVSVTESYDHISGAPTDDQGFEYALNGTVKGSVTRNSGQSDTAVHAVSGVTPPPLTGTGVSGAWPLTIDTNHSIDNPFTPGGFGGVLGVTLESIDRLVIDIVPATTYG